MRCKQELMLRSPTLPVDYRRIFLSLFKTGLDRYAGGRYFNEFYGTGQNSDKNFSFSIALPKGSVFQQKSIHLTQARISMIVSTGDSRTGILLNNSLLQLRGYEHPLPDGNAMTVGHLAPMQEPLITGRQIIVQFLSPLCIREHQSGKDRYITVADSDFQEQFCRSVAYELRSKLSGELTPKRISLLPLKMRHTKVLHYNTYIPVSIGTGVLCGEPEILQALSQFGVGSRRGSGFGLFRVLSESEVDCL